MISTTIFRSLQFFNLGHRYLPNKKENNLKFNSHTKDNYKIALYVLQTGTNLNPPQSKAINIFHQTVYDGI